MPDPKPPLTPDQRKQLAAARLVHDAAAKLAKARALLAGFAWETTVGDLADSTATAARRVEEYAKNGW